MPLKLWVKAAEMRKWVVLLLPMVIAACSGGVHEDSGRDPSKLDPAMEIQARSLEERANLAAAQVEQEALAELQRVEAEARANAAASSAAAANSDTSPTTESPRPSRGANQPAST